MLGELQVVGLSVWAVATELNQRGEATPHDGRWHAVSFGSGRSGSVGLRLLGVASICCETTTVVIQQVWMTTYITKVIFLD